MNKRVQLSPEILISPLQFKTYLNSIFRPSEDETISIFDLAVELKATNLQLFNLAGVCYSNQKFGFMRACDIDNFDYISDEGGFNFYLPKKKTVTIYRGLYLADYYLKNLTIKQLKEYINSNQFSWESWTLNKDVAKFFSRDNGVILTSQVQSNNANILGLNVYGHLPEAEIIIDVNNLDFEFEYEIGTDYSNCWQKNYEWLNALIKHWKNDLNSND